MCLSPLWWSNFTPEPAQPSRLDERRPWAPHGQLPESGQPVRAICAPDAAVLGDQRVGPANCLPDQHAVEGVLVFCPRQMVEGRGILGRERQVIECLGETCLKQRFRPAAFELQFAESRLEGDFPKSYCADEHLIRGIRDDLARLRAEPLRLDH